MFGIGGSTSGYKNSHLHSSRSMCTLYDISLTRCHTWLSFFAILSLSLSLLQVMDMNMDMVSGEILIGRGASIVYPNPQYHYPFRTMSGYGNDTQGRSTYSTFPETVSDNNPALAVNRSVSNFYLLPSFPTSIGGLPLGGSVLGSFGHPKYQYGNHLIAPIKLSHSYTTSIWFDWLGLGAVISRGIQNDTTLYIAQGQGENGVSASLYISTTGYVTASHGSFSIVDPDPVTLHWTQYTTAYDGSTGFLALYRNGALVASGTDTTQSFIGSVPPTILLNTPTFNNLFVGMLSAWSVWNSSLTSSEVWWYYWTNNPTYVVPLPGSTPPPPTIPSINRWWGHFNTTEVSTQSRTISQPTGWLNISGVIFDADLRPSNLLWVRMNGVKQGTYYGNGSVLTPVVIPGVGSVTWDAPTYIMIIRPESLIPAGTPFSFVIPPSALSLFHPSYSVTTWPNDNRWQMAITLDPDQTGGRSQGLRWQAIHYTPETFVSGFF